MQQAPQPTPADDLLAQTRPPVALASGAYALAGTFAAGVPVLSPLPYLLGFAAAALFAAASLFAAYYERAAALRERPFSAPPEGEAPPGSLWALGWGLLALGILLPWTGGQAPLLAGVGVALTLVLHAAWLKEVWGVGFLAFGAAQGLAFLMGLSVEEAALAAYAPAALPVAAFGVAWELLRAVRQPGAPPATAFMALLHLVGAISALLFFTMTRFSQPIDSAPFLVVLLAITFPRFVRVVLQPQPTAVLEAVQFGVLGMIVLAADLAGGLSAIVPGLVAAAPALLAFQALRRWPVPLVTRLR